MPEAGNTTEFSFFVEQHDNTPPEFIDPPANQDLACGSAIPEQWASKARNVDFYDLKGDVERLLALRGDDRDVAFEPLELPYLHPGQAARVLIDGESAGWIGALHPASQAALGIKARVFAFELDIDRITNREIPSANKISSFPSVRRDLAFLVPEAVTFREIETLVQEEAGELLRQLTVFDQFSGQTVEKGYKSLAIGLILQDVSCTLTDEVVDSVIDRVIKGLESRLEAQLRG